MQKHNVASRFLAWTLCWSLLLPMLPVPVRAMDGFKYVEVEVGQPSVWSLGQAHYLLANMHDRNRDLSTKLPNEDALDPNRINSSRLETLQRVLSLEAQFDQSVGAENEAEMQRFRNDQARQRQAGAELQARRAALTQVENELLLLNEELATLQELDRQSTETRTGVTPPLPPTSEDNARKVQIAILKVRVEQKTQEKTRIEGEITALATAASTAPTAPNLTGPSLSEGKAGLPSSAAFTKFVDKALDNMGQPSLAATTALDNFVGMQYEIIAKQLTLLRDEVGPEERVIFLELPASIYTVDGWADDYLARVEWEVTHYYDKEPPPEEVRKQTCGTISQQWKAEDKKTYEAGLSPYQIQTCIENRGETDDARHGEIYETQNPPITLDMLNFGDRQPAALEDGRRKVRAIDIIPRQSSLNVSEYHATVKNVGILGLLRWISGFGAKLDFQQQREAYEQFVQQDVFASGFGKGLNKFGWTFGPQPGTRRLAPGQRTTYAVLAIPRKTLALDVTAKRYVFKRSRAPRKNDVVDFNFRISVPGPKTESFTVERINYTPVPKGRRTTVVIKGSYFSPQLGAMVNGTHLSRVISIARTGSKEVAPSAPGSDVQGEFELTNSQQMVLNFSTGPDFVGTPIITLITPEKSLAINYLAAFINNRDKIPISLQRASSYEPMFTDGFNLTPKIEKIDSKVFNGKTFIVARLQGKGLRHDCDIWLNNRRFEVLKDTSGSAIRFASAKDIESSYGTDKEFVVQESTNSYILYVEDPKTDKWAIRYRQRNRQGFDESSFEQSFAIKPFSHEIRNYRRGAAGGPAEVHLTLASAEKKITKVTLLEPRPTECELQGVEAKSRRAKCLVPRDGSAERGFITLKVDFDSGDPHFEDITLPVRPSVPVVTNPTTGNASGPASLVTFANLKGENLLSVKAVFFGDLEATLHSSDDTGLWVKVPKVDGVPKGQSMVVPVLFQLKGEEAKTPSGAFYTYFGEPIAPELVAWPCLGPGPCGPADSAKPKS